MEALLYFAFWAGLIFLMMRFGCGAHIMGHAGPQSHAESNSNGSPKWIPPEEDIDPVCNKKIVTKGARSSVHLGDVFYFCSRECREVFEAAPDLYIGKNKSETHELEHSNA